MQAFRYKMPKLPSKLQVFDASISNTRSRKLNTNYQARGYIPPSFLSPNVMKLFPLPYINC